MDSAYLNRALAMTGSGYRVLGPDVAGNTRQYAEQGVATMQRQEAEARARAEQSRQTTQGLVGLAAALYTGGAFGAAQGATAAAQGASAAGAASTAGAAAPAAGAAGGFADGAMSEAIKQAGSAGGQQAASNPGMLKGILGRFAGGL